MTYMLGIESSCDDTSVAILNESQHILANEISSQLEEHAPFMGVVPELASRAHLKNIRHVYRTAMSKAGTQLTDLTAIAVTAGPGLVGSLTVGINFAKALAFGTQLPLIGVNHIRGHVAALFIEHPHLELPALALIVSGGHTHLFLVDEDRTLVLLTKTRDDAAGEAYDKLSKMLGLGFPGGPIIDRLAQQGDPSRFSFSKPKFNDGSSAYSFSGLKSAASRYIQKTPNLFRAPNQQAVHDLCASFQQAVTLHLCDRVHLALKKEKVFSLLLGGGVACNSQLRASFSLLAQMEGLPAYLSSPDLSTDNAAMIAAEGWLQFQKGYRSSLSLSANVRSKPFEKVRLL